MASTKLKKRAVRSKLNDKEMRFVMEYLVDYNGVRAVKAAGYSWKNNSQASVMACRLLKKKHIADMVGKLRRETVEKLELDREEVLKQLFYLATRSGADFVDDDGHIITDLRKLPERACQAVDGIEQDITTTTYDDGSTIERVKTKLKLVGKGGAIDMAMKRFGLYAPQEVEGQLTVKLPWDQLVQGPNGEADLIESRIVEAGKITEQKKLGQDKGAK